MRQLLVVLVLVAAWAGLSVRPAPPAARSEPVPASVQAGERPTNHPRDPDESWSSSVSVKVVTVSRFGRWATLDVSCPGRVWGYPGERNMGRWLESGGQVTLSFSRGDAERLERSGTNLVWHPRRGKPVLLARVGAADAWKSLDRLSYPK